MLSSRGFSLGGEAEADRTHSQREADPAGRQLPLLSAPGVLLQGES